MQIKISDLIREQTGHIVGWKLYAGLCDPVIGMYSDFGFSSFFSAFFSSGSGGNIITRRLCRNRRREDNELYRSNSFKFERFERKEYLEELADTLQKQVSESSQKLGRSETKKKYSTIVRSGTRTNLAKKGNFVTVASKSGRILMFFFLVKRSVLKRSHENHLKEEEKLRRGPL